MPDLPPEIIYDNPFEDAYSDIPFDTVPPDSGPDAPPDEAPIPYEVPGKPLKAVKQPRKGSALPKAATNGHNPFTSVALQAANNLTDHLNFIVQRILDKSALEDVYNHDIIHEAALVDRQTCFMARERLAKKFNKDFNKRHWDALVREARAAEAVKSEDQLVRSESGAIKPILLNCRTALQRLQVPLGYDTFSQKITKMAPTIWDTGAGGWEDLDDLRGAAHLQRQDQGQICVTPELVAGAALMLAREHEFHPVRDWLASLEWDGHWRIATWVTDYLGAPDTAFCHEAGRCWLISAIARIMRPGVKADHVLVLEGQQGKLKSTALRALANGHLDSDGGVQWFCDTLPNLDHKDLEQHLQGRWIIEMGELDAIRKNEWSQVKSFFAKQADSYRAPYGRHVHEYPRQCVFAASTNEHDYLSDPTGARRFWPCPIDNIAVDRLLRDRDQLWAEALSQFVEGRTWWLDADIEEEARKEQALRFEDHPWMVVLTDHFAGHIPSSVTPEQLLDKPIGIALASQKMADKQLMCRVLSRMGWAQEANDDGAKVWVKR